MLGVLHLTTVFPEYDIMFAVMACFFTFPPNFSKCFLIYGYFSLIVWLRMHYIHSSQESNNKEEVEDLYLSKLQVSCLPSHRANRELI